MSERGSSCLFVFVAIFLCGALAYLVFLQPRQKRAAVQPAPTAKAGGYVSEEAFKYALDSQAGVAHDAFAAITTIAVVDSIADAVKSVTNNVTWMLLLVALILVILLFSRK